MPATNLNVYYTKGYNAYYEGKSFEDCPYKDERSNVAYMKEAWESGFGVACVENSEGFDNNR